jgi:hypothetical protein
VKQISSETTGVLSRASEGARQTGLQHGETGSERLPKIASERLQASHPKETDATLEASLASPVTSCLGRTVDRYRNARGEFIVESRPGATAPCQDRKALDRALKAYESACLPAPEKTVYAELAALKTKTKSAQADDDDLRFQMQIYAREFQKYPADVALHVIRTHANMETFWPSWAELKERLDLYAKRRLDRLKQIRELVSLSEGA